MVVYVVSMVVYVVSMVVYVVSMVVYIVSMLVCMMLSCCHLVCTAVAQILMVVYEALVATDDPNTWPTHRWGVGRSTPGAD